MKEVSITVTDVIVSIVLLVIVFLIGRMIRDRNRENPIYRFYLKGLMAKAFGGLALCLVYIYYYGDGDTIGYFRSAKLLCQLFTYSPETYFDIMANNLTVGNYWQFANYNICCPEYYKDPNSYAVVRFSSPLVGLSFFSFPGATILMAALSYAGVWRLFLLFNEIYPGIERKLAIAILFIPSVLFWGSGILKDTITFSAACWFTYSVYKVFITKEKRLKFLIILVVSAYFIISIKPYIFVALLPGSAIWISFSRISRIKSTFIRLMVAPFVIGSGMLASSYVMSLIGTELGDFSSIDKALTKAAITQSDLTREAYGDNSFNIGQIDGTVGRALAKFPQATIAGLFRPFIWESRSIIIFFSALENTFLLIMTLRALFSVGIFGLFVRMSKEPLLFFSIVFSIFFAFSVGLSTANFGALVRYKIPCIPFFLCTMYILQTRTREKSDKAAEVLPPQLNHDEPKAA